MIKADSIQLKEILATWVITEVRRSGSATNDLAPIQDAVQTVLNEPQLTAQEQTLIVEAASNYEDPLDLALTLRIERALRAGANAAVDEATNLDFDNILPTMVVMRDGAMEHQTEAVETMVATLGATLSGSGAKQKPVLVLSEKLAFENLQSQSASLATVSSSVRFVDDLSSMDLTVENEITVQVVEDLLQTVIGQASELVVSKGLSVKPVDPMIGRLFANKYEIGKCVGRGGFGSVYLARDTLLDNRVAIKVLTPRTAITEVQKAAFKEQLNDFVEEARRLVRLEHENIVNWKVFDQTEDGTYFFVMELLQGEELEDLLKREGRLEPKRVAKILLQILEALNTAHNISEHESILHLDLKPKNIFYLDKASPDAPDRIKVIDFGIGQYIGANKSVDAKATKSASANGDGPSDSAQANDLATSEHERDDGGTLKSIIHRSTACTPEYASPEQCTHMLPESRLEELGTKFMALDGRSDLYSLGVMGFQLLTGKLPFERPSQRKDFFHLHIAQPPRKVGKQGIKIPRKLAKFIEQCLVKDRDKRWKNTSDACHALRKVVNPPIWKPIALVGAPLLALVGFLAWQANSGAENLFPPPRGPIYASAQSPRKLIELKGLPSDQVGLPTIVVNDPADLSSRLPWQAVWENKSLFLKADSDAPLEANAFLVIDHEGSAPYKSRESFKLVYLDSEAVSIREATVAELGFRAVDPEGQSMDIRIQGRASDISRVTVRSGSSERSATLVSGSVQNSETAHYAVGLQALQLVDGENQLEIEVEDKSGATITSAQVLQVARGALTANQAILDGVPTYANRYRVLPSSKPRLQIELNRKADIRWSLQLDSGGAPQPLSQTSKPVARLDVELDLTSDSAYQGSILVEISEGNYVLHSSSSSNTSSYKLPLLEFDFSDEAPDFLATYRNGNTSTRTIELGGTPAPIFLNRTTAELEITLNQTSPVYFEIARVGADSIAFEQALTDRLQTSLKPTLDLGGPGIHHFEIRGFPCDTQTNEKLGEAVVLTVQFVVDNTAPVLKVTGPSDVVLREAGWTIPPVTVSVQDSSAHEIATPVNFDWEVRTNNTRVDGARWKFPVTADTELPIDITFSPTAKIPDDGTYEVLISGTDSAGNPATEDSYSFEVAMEGPRLILESPDDFAPWDIAPQHESKRYEVRVQATDPNGVAGVHCMLVDRTDESHNEELELKLLRQTGFQEQWIGYFDLRSDWSEKEIELRFTALDRHDIEGPLLSARRAMAIIEDYTPEYIELTLKADVSANLSPMCKVRGNRGAEYISRGRADSTENALFKKAFQNLRYNTKTLARSWEIRYEAGQISDFYLDETEVSVEQFAKFVAAASGYQNSDNWLHGVSPKTSRRDQLASQLKSLAPDLPVTEVTWDEASAYARWSGKRLPSIIEWEYAVRGGPNYRPYSAYRDEQGVTLDTADFRYDTFGSEPWKVTRGKDLTPDTGIRNLCTNVSEWCASPKLFDGVGGKQAKVHAQSHPEWVLDPSLAPGGLRKSSSFWTVGGCYSSSRLDFSEVAPRYRDLMDPSVGFRCAVSASEVLNAMESASENHWEVHERSK